MSSLSLELPATSHAPARARALVREAARQTGVTDDDRWRVEMIVTELVTNAVKHGPGGPVEIAISAGGNGVRGEIGDPGPGIHGSRLVRRRATEEGGRGLFLVDALSDSWGLSGDRSRVWFEVAPSA
ncbi:MAG TPA: ATP-binding protein [Thermoleophilaceae bacterium]|nr:ATP-binding protein [Thermoleophilaceae bacterium]